MNTRMICKRLSIISALALTLSAGIYAQPAPDLTAAAAEIAAASAISGNVSHDFTADGLSSSYFEITGNLSTGKGTADYKGKTLTQCLKMESATSIAFTTAGNAAVTLVITGGESLYVDSTKYTLDGSGILTVNVGAGAHTIKKGSGSSNLFYIDVVCDGSAPIVTTVTAQQSGTVSSATTASAAQGGNGGGQVGSIKLLSSGGWNEMLYAAFSGISDGDVTGVSYSGAANGTLSGDDLTYLVRDVSGGVRVDIPGVPAGSYTLTLTTKKGSISVKDIAVSAQDRSGFAHFNYTAGVGAYTDAGTLKANAIVLYVTNENKDTVTVKSKDGTTVTGIGNILNSAGKTSKGGTANTNKGIIEKLAKDGTPLVVRIIGDVKAPEGLTVYDSVDNGGSVGDNGFMARMQSGKDITIEGIGADATVNGWGFHFICESGNPTLGKSFEVRNIKFRNVPEDCIGMEGVQEGSNVTAPVERCWIHNNEFYKPTISNPAESDKAGGDGACDFKRGNYFTNSYNYYEGYHKTNLVGASDSNLQFHITFHHNYWNKCESRGPLARQANIHMYNNIFEGQTSYCQNPRADAYIFSEYNLFDSCKNPQQIKQGAIKSFNDTLTNCKGSMDATVVSSKTQKVSSNNKYGDFDTNASLSYIPAGEYVLQTNTAELKGYFTQWGGTLDETSGASGKISGDVQTVPPASTTTTTTTTTVITTTTTTSAETTTTTSAETTATTTTTTATETTVSGVIGEVRLGDVNCSGEVDVIDAVLLARFVAGDPTADLNAASRVNADVDGDGVITASDLTRLIRILARLI